MISDRFSVSRRNTLRLLAGGAAAGLAAGLPASPAGAAARVWSVTGRGATSLKPFDDTLKRFMQARTIPHASLAVVRKGKLVLARGYNWTADTSFAAGPTSLFRVASLSKPITAAAVLKLAQDGKLSLSAKVAPLLRLSTAADPRLAAVTVTHLLQHLGGWDSEVSGDPMFRDRVIAAALGVPLPITQAQIIAHTSGLKLDHAPGTTYAYSNYGYVLLQKIIERVSGVSYASYVQSKVLTPLKIKRMALGRTAKSLRKSGEAPYFSQYTGKSVIDTSNSVLPFPYGGFNLGN
ncbi:serine hydrolase domain-containing protein, partial [Microbispora tritici]